MTSINRPAQFPHQIVDTQSLLDKPAYALFCDPGTGKSRTVVDAVNDLHKNGDAEALIVVCPAPARSVWVDPSPVLGEFTRWAAPDLRYTLQEYHQRTNLDTISGPGLHVLVTNPEFIRRVERLRPLQAWARRRRTMLVADESWLYKTPNATQTKAMYRLRACASRVAILNGTPGELKDQYSQFRILDPEILDQFNHAAFRAHYCVMGGYMNKQVVSYRNTEEFHRRTAPYCVVRKLRDCVDMGPEPIRTQIEAPLTPTTWRVYCELRDELVTWLSEHEHVTAMQAGVKTMRLAQITNGFVGGVSTNDEMTADLFDSEDLATASDLPDVVTFWRGPCGSSDRQLGEGMTLPAPPSTLREVGREKLDALIRHLKDYWRDSKLVVFTRFRPDVERTQLELAKAFARHEVVKIYGSQDADERARAKVLLAPGGDKTPAIGVVNAQSGGASLNLAAAQLCVFLGNDYSYRIRRQAEGRVDRVGQTGRVTLLDILAVGPNGQRTVDHQIVAALRRGEQLEEWSASEWLKALCAS